MKLIFFLILFCFNIYAEETVAVVIEPEINEAKINTLSIIKNNLEQTKNLVHAKENQVKEEKDEKRKIILLSDLKRLNERYSKIKLNLISTITNIKVDEIKNDDQPTKRDLLNELQTLLAPALDTIQRISARPRKIEKLKNEIEQLEQKRNLADEALKNLDNITHSDEFKPLLSDLEGYLEEAKFNVNDLKQELLIAEDKFKGELNNLTRDDKSVFEASTEMLKKFFSNKGKHLGYSIFVFIFSLWIFRQFRTKIINRFLENRPDQWYVKPVNALYGLFSFMTSTTLSLITLYVVGDWILVTFFILAFTSAVWASKDYIHKYLAQGRLILNLGTIKEGELVIYRDLPWKVKNISFVTTFENEFLDTTEIRIEIGEIFKMHSRKILLNERWFPTKAGDWVILNDQTFGKVSLQTVEQVIIEMFGGHKKHYLTLNYLQQNPINLSHGYSVSFIFGIDYNTQNKISSIISTLKTKLLTKIKTLNIPAIDPDLEFHSAGESSLNLLVSANFLGNYANHRFKFERDLQLIMTEICSEESINIPFKQMVIHMDEKCC